MGDAELIYYALLRAEKRLQPPTGTVIVDTRMMEQLAAFKAVQTLREEVGNGLAKRGPVPHALKAEG
jgi:hypothetical protein